MRDTGQNEIMWAPVINLRRAAMALALIGIVVKVVLFEWIGITSAWTPVTRLLNGTTVVLGLLTILLATIDFGRSRGHWVPLVAFILGLITFAPVLGVAV
jgi:hypothetical protein